MNIALTHPDPAIPFAGAPSTAGHASLPPLTVDARMLFNSGIGTVIRNVLSEWHDTHPDLDLVAIARETQSMDWLATHTPRFQARLVRSPIYSIREQFSLPLSVPRDRLLWSPHFNVPLATAAPVVATVHDTLHIAHPEFFPGALKRLYSRGILAGAAWKARRLIAVSHFTAGELVRLIGARKEQITVVHNGVAADWFQIPPAPSPAERPYLLCVGNVKPHKNLARLFRAFGQAAASLPDHDLVVVGRKEGFITGDPAALAAAAPLGSRVRFTGFLADSELKRWVSHAAALVFPSLYEGFGLPPLEAMAAGCPVLAADIPALRESCAGAALYCDPYSAEEMAASLITIASLPSGTRDQLVAAGRARARAFTWAKAAHGVLDVLQKCQTLALA